MSRAIKAAAATDLRQGVTEAEHAVLDRAEALEVHEASIPMLLAFAKTAVRAAQGADPNFGVGKRRVDRAQEAAALLIKALNRMDAEGREVKP